MNTLVTDINREPVHLLPQRALYWPRAETLLIADPHWGKAATFRAASIALPGEPIHDDLARLSTAIRQTRARRLLVLGDLLHARRGRAPETFAAVGAWREEFPTLEIELVRGNHDRGAGDPPDDWRIDCREQPLIEMPFAFLHEPVTIPGHYALAGHLHPGAVLAGGGQRLKLPCFWFTAHYGVLPAFGSFTGLVAIQPAPSDRVFVVADAEVVQAR